MWPWGSASYRVWGRMGPHLPGSPQPHEEVHLSLSKCRAFVNCLFLEAFISELEKFSCLSSPRQLPELIPLRWLFSCRKDASVL